MTSLKVLLVGEDNRSRTTIMDILSHEPSFEVVAHADSVVEAITYTYLMYPDLVFLQVGIPGVSAAEVSSWIKRFAPGTKVVFVAPGAAVNFDNNGGSSESDGFIQTGKLDEELPAFLEKFKGVHSGEPYPPAGFGQSGA